MSEKEKYEGKKPPFVIVGILSVLLALALFQSYQISTLSSLSSGISGEISGIKASINGIKSSGVAVTTVAQASKPAASKSDTLQQVLKEITPTGTPDYGEKAGVSYDNVVAGLATLKGYASLPLSPEEQQRFDTVANTEGTPCKYCCGATKLSQNCGCSHNIALQGLTKWLIKNTSYSNDQILQEIHKWQILFFPKPTVQEELQKRNINPESVGLPAMRGGC